MDSDLHAHIQRLEDGALFRALTLDRAQYQPSFLTAARAEAQRRSLDIEGQIERAAFYVESTPETILHIDQILDHLRGEWPQWQIRTIRHCFNHALAIQRECHSWSLHHYIGEAYQASFFLPTRSAMCTLVEDFLSFRDDLHATEPRYDLDSWYTVLSVPSARYLMQLADRLHDSGIPHTVQTPTLSGDASHRLSLRVPIGEKRAARDVLRALEAEVRALYAAAQDAFAAQDARRELEQYAALTAFGLNNPAVFYNLGVALIETGRHAEASAALIEAISLWLSALDAPVLSAQNRSQGVLGSVLGMLQGERATGGSAAERRELPDGVAAAERWLMHLRTYLPESVDILRALGATAAVRNDHESAELHYRALLQLCPGDVEAVRYLEERTAFDS